jgi:hypothetical protein
MRKRRTRQRHSDLARAIELQIDKDAKREAAILGPAIQSAKKNPEVKKIVGPLIFGSVKPWDGFFKAENLAVGLV